MMSMSSSLIIFPEERPVFLKEENSHLYNVRAYFVGRTLVELPFFVLTPLIWSLITYFAVGLNTELAS